MNVEWPDLTLPPINLYNVPKQFLEVIMKAKMKEDVVEIYMTIMPYCIDDEIIKFLHSIRGKEVELVFICGDAFEKNNDDIWLPNELWDEIT